MRSRLLISSFVALSACAPSSSPSFAESRSEIIGGTLATGDPAVVSLSRNLYGVWSHSCTGTLIAPQTILTAAHCTSSSTLHAVFGPSTANPTRAVRVVEQHRHPNYSDAALVHDIAVLKLQTPVVDVTPIAINTTSLGTGWVGQPLRQVGFGLDALGGSAGTKREVTFNIRSVQSGLIQVGEGGKQICFGDSGGPGFITLPGTSQEVVAGVASFTVNSCRETGYDTRVDAYVSFVESTMKRWENPTCDPDWVCVPGCTPVDLDCACAADRQCTSACVDPARDPDCPTDCRLNGICSEASCPIPDPDCRLEGETCASDQSCLSQVCVSDAQSPRMYCSRACTDDAQCPDLMECVSGTCAYKQRPPANVGEACTDLTYCLFGSICTGPSEDSRFCAMPCGGSACDYGSAECQVSYRGALYCQPASAPAPDAGTVTPVPQGPGGTTAEGGTDTGALEPVGCASMPGRTALALLALALVRRRRS